MARRIRRPVGYVDLADDDYDSDLELPDDFDNDDVAAVCAYPVPELRKAVVAMRRKMGLVGGKPTRAQLVPMLLAHKAWDPDWRRLKAAMEGDMSLTDLRGLRSETKEWHPPTSKMSRDELIKYCYDTATILGWNWTMPNRRKKKRVGRACEEARRPGQAKKAPRSVISKRGKPPSTRQPTRYNSHVKAFMNNPAFRSKYPDATDRMRAAAEAWQNHRGRRDAVSQRKDDEAEQRKRRTVKASNARMQRDRATKKRKTTQAAARKAARAEAVRRKRATDATGPIPKKSQYGLRSRKRAAPDSDSDEEVTIAELRAQLTDARKRARVAEIEEAGGVMAMARRQAQQRARRNFDDDPDL
jgi:hypothetical protein